jgi:hypothetical protein
MKKIFKLAILVLGCFATQPSFAQAVAIVYRFKGAVKLVHRGGESKVHVYQRLFPGDRLICEKSGSVWIYGYHEQKCWIASPAAVVEATAGGISRISGPPLQRTQGLVLNPGPEGVQGVGFLRGAPFGLEGPILAQRKAPAAVRWSLIKPGSIESAEIWISGPAVKGGWTRSDFQIIDHKELGAGALEYPLSPECRTVGVHYFYRLRLKYVMDGKKLEWEMPHVDYFVLSPSDEARIEKVKGGLNADDPEVSRGLALFYWHEGLIDDCKRMNEAILRRNSSDEAAQDALVQIDRLHGVVH